MPIPLDHWKLCIQSACLSIPLAILFLILTTPQSIIIKKYYPKADEFLLIILMFTFIIIDTFSWFNAKLDQSQPNFHTEKIFSKNKAGGRASKYYQVYVEDWRYPQEKLLIHVPNLSDVYSKIRIDVDRAEIITRQGRFNYEWEQSSKLLKTNP